MRVSRLIQLNQGKRDLFWKCCFIYLFIFLSLSLVSHSFFGQYKPQESHCPQLPSWRLLVPCCGPSLKSGQWVLSVSNTGNLLTASLKRKWVRQEALRSLFHGLVLLHWWCWWVGYSQEEEASTLKYMCLKKAECLSPRRAELPAFRLLTYYKVILQCHLDVESKIWHKWTYLQSRNRLTDIRNKVMVTKGERMWGGDKLGVRD